ncbi:hypothetical protein [Gallibacterium genomosp. 1]|uniref:hypothetical protein n=1 Tax=Gallibacterium genomosp. 1 TaxID=155515 RepID=UPI0008026DED|nr:hypothetical protein [Gallibacterium genomosp. 1]OBX01777.1 hypothetical protein QV04_04650 [Gallibacterium genomosp. 1]
MKLNQVTTHYHKYSQLIVLTGILLGGGISLLPLTVNAAVDQAEVIKKVATGTELSQDEKDWFTSFFGGRTLQKNEKALEYQGPTSEKNGGYIFNAPYTFACRVIPTAVLS